MASKKIHAVFFIFSILIWSFVYSHESHEYGHNHNHMYEQNHNHEHNYHHHHTHSHSHEINIFDDFERDLTTSANEHICGTRDPTDRELEQHEKVIQYHRTKIGSQRLSMASNHTVNITVHFHVLHHPNFLGFLSESKIHEQMQILNNAFAGKPSNYSECAGKFTYDTDSQPVSPFNFQLESITYTIDEAAFRLDSVEFKEKQKVLRKGTCADLNIYSGRSFFLGLAYFPKTCPQNGNISDPFLEDGVLISYKTVPGGSETHFDQGDTLVHEVGHWLGLYHTFSGNCGDKDYVWDTASQRSPTTECPVGRDSCEAEGIDPIHNYMDYSDDCCMYRFTEGQVEKMILESSLFRGLGPNNVTLIEAPWQCEFPTHDGFNYSQCDVPNKCFINDGYCDSVDVSGQYNTPECNFDGCDCADGDNGDGAIRS